MERFKFYRTDFLYPRTNMLTGMGTIFNLAGKYFTFNYSAEADKHAIDNDWGMVGTDIAKTIEQNPANTFKAM